MNKTTVKTRAIVLHSIKYGDNSLIVKMLTEESGLLSFMVKNVFGKKSKMKAALFQNRTLLDIVSESGNGSLSFIKELSLAHYYKDITTNIKKSTIIFFISELLSKTITESETDTALFDFIFNAMIWLDEAENDYVNFPILFAIRLSAYLGFFPNIDTYSEGSCFDLLDGNFKKNQNDIYQMEPELSRTFYEILEVTRTCDSIGDSLKFSSSHRLTDLETHRLSLKERRKLLEHIATYYKLHVEDMRELGSYEILKTVFEN